MPRVLLVDDDPDILESTQYLIEAEGYQVDTARNGQEALDRLQVQRPDVILLDLMMPVMDGWQFADRLRKTVFANVPIVVLSATHALAERAKQIPATAYLAKPFDIDELLRKLASAIRSASPAST